MENARENVLGVLRELAIPFRLVCHPAVFTMEELSKAGLAGGEKVAKNLFLRDDKKRRYFLATMRGDRTADLKALRKTLGCRPLSFASEEELGRMLALQKGAVTPFGLFNDAERRAECVLDRALFSADEVGVHPNDNTATVFLRPADLVRALEAKGCSVSVVDFD